MSQGRVGRRWLACARHGRTEWTGQVICVRCGSVWHLTVPAECPPTTDKTCRCGADLVGEAGSARAICGSCYRAKRAAQVAAAPN